MNVVIQINGEPREVAVGMTIPELLAELSLPTQNALVEHNGVALFQTEWNAIHLAEGDRVEIIRVVAGG